jgi:AraC-like DNA-binding protein
MVLGFIDIINFIAMFQLLVFVFFLLRKKSKRQSNKILAVFLLAQFFILYDYESYILRDYLIKISPHFFYIGTGFILLAAPTFYLYVKSLAFEDFRVHKYHFLHALPFIMVSVFFLYYFHFKYLLNKQPIFPPGSRLSPGFWLFYNFVILSQILIYFIIDLNILKNYRNEIKQQYSSVKNINLSWLSFILYAFIVSWISSVIVFLSRNYFWDMIDILVILNFLAFFIFFNFIFYKGLAQPEIFSGIEEKPKYVSSKLTSSDAESYLNRLNCFMDGHKPYLNPDLTLKELSSELSIPARYLSQIINEHMQSNFYDYISKFRIEEAKKILSDTANNKTVLEILYEVGFNSKSSFNTAFKKFTGVTPSRFKETSLADS